MRTSGFVFLICCICRGRDGGADPFRTEDYGVRMPQFYRVQRNIKCELILIHKKYRKTY